MKRIAIQLKVDANSLDIEGVDKRWEAERKHRLRISREIPAVSARQQDASHFKVIEYSTLAASEHRQPSIAIACNKATTPQNSQLRLANVHEP